MGFPSRGNMATLNLFSWQQLNLQLKGAYNNNRQNSQFFFLISKLIGTILYCSLVAQFKLLSTFKGKFYFHNYVNQQCIEKKKKENHLNYPDKVIIFSSVDFATNRQLIFPRRVTLYQISKADTRGAFIHQRSRPISDKVCGCMKKYSLFVYDSLFEKTEFARKTKTRYPNN